MIVVPIAFLLVVALSTYSLLSYRSGITQAIEARQTETLKLALKLAETVAAGRASSTGQIRDLLPQADYFAISSPDGRPMLEGGSNITGTPLGEFDLLGITGASALGPDKARDYVAAVAPTVWNGEPAYVRLDIGAPELSRQLRNIGALTWVVLPINAALSVLVLLFLRQLLAPYDKLLAAARRVRGKEESPEDEVAFLITSFERAIQTLESERSPEQELATLELALGPSLESGFLLLDRAGKVLALNPAGADLLSCKAPEPGTPVRDLLAEHGALGPLIADAIESSRPIQRREVEIVRRAEAVPLGLSIHPLRRDDGEVRGFLTLFADLTETRRKAQEEQLSFSLAQVGELAAGVAHEMRNSLSTFRGYLTLVERAPEEETITDYLVELRRETDHLQRVLEDFLSFARPESTRSELLNLESILRRAAVDPALEGTTVEIESLGHLPVLGDSQLLERAVRNLLHNACQAHEAAGVDHPVTVRAARQGDEAVVEILDRGPGVSKAVSDRLFEPFVSGRRGGIGLGLALSRRIVDLHGGRLELGARPGGGTVASLSIGLSEEPTHGSISGGTSETPRDPDS